MAITVDSSQWTGEQDSTKLAHPVVWGEFDSEAARDRAIRFLHAQGERPEAENADTGTLPPAPNGGLDAPDENPVQADQRNQRQLGVGIAMAAASMGAAGLVIATGGAALPAVAAAAAAGIGAGAVGETVANAAQPDPGAAPMPAPTDAPVIGIRAVDDAARSQAETVLKELGAIRVFVQDRS